MAPSVEDLVAASLVGEEDDEAAWEAVRTLRALGTREVFDAACALLDSPAPRARGRGADVLAQLGLPAEAVFVAESVDRLVPRLASELDPAVIASICVALGHLGDARAVPAVAAWADHPDENVRFSVVQGLCRQDDALAVATLIALSADVDDDVRDWATFALGSLLELDTPELRAALEARLADQSADVRDEALVGLAQRGDVRMRGRIRDELARDSVGILAVEAAQALGDRSLLPELIALRDREGECDEYFRSVLDDAIAALGG